MAASIGDLSQHFRMVRQTGLTKSSLNTLANELATGRHDDLAKALGGDTSWLSNINREISTSQQYGSSASETGRRLNFVQTSLQQVEDLREGLAQRFISLEPSGSVQKKLDASVAAVEAFKSIVGTINQTFSGKSLLGGTVTDRPPLADAETMLADIGTQITGLTTAADISAAVESWFDDPAGGFNTFGYQGDDGPLESRRISASESVLMEARADQSGIKDVLKATAHAAIIHDLEFVLDEGELENLVKGTMGSLLQSGDVSVELRGRVGFSEARVEEVRTNLAAQVASLGIIRNDSVLADPFETSSSLLNAQQQLELQFSMTARLSKLSLVNYLR